VIAGLPDAHASLAAAAYKLKQIKKASVPIGILSGIVAGWLYNRYSDIKLPDYLAFFAGRRFVPIVSGLAGLGLAFAFGLGWPFVERGMDAMSHAIIESGSVGLFVYGALNRLLIVTGLHHILNNVAWFLVGDFNGVTGDLNRFFAGDPRAGAFMSGFFPVMMFGLPAACLAMYRTALPERKKAVGGLLLSMGLTSFLTGVTEPIEFTFMFLAPALYAVHAILTGLAMVTMDLLHSRLGFGFSAGLFDYALNFNKATHPIYLLPVGALYFALYYYLFVAVITRFNLRTPGRDPEETRGAGAAAPVRASDAAGAYVVALGGAANLRDVSACTTRLRLELADRSRVDRDALKRLGARGTVDTGDAGLQVVVGPMADGIASDIRAHLASGGGYRREGAPRCAGRQGERRGSESGRRAPARHAAQSRCDRQATPRERVAARRRVSRARSPADPARATRDPRRRHRAATAVTIPREPTGVAGTQWIAMPSAHSGRSKRPAPPGGLRYSRDGEKGYTRRHSGNGFEYFDAKGEKLTAGDTLERIKSLAIPPAWTDVWICGDERGHLQATGRDARGTKAVPLPRALA
jgi:PTS system N-acetylglucosamine-specific IIC component